jgi:hypothetical protein
MSNEIYNELKRMQEKERQRQIDAALQGHELTPVQMRQLSIEIANNTTFRDGELLAVDSDGSPLTDPHGWPLPVRDHIRQTASTLLKLTPATPLVKPPANADELFWALRNAKTEEERDNIQTAFRQR